MIHIDMRNKQCPIPVIETRKQLKLTPMEEVIVFVDNKIAVENLQKLGKQMSCKVSVNEKSKKEYEVILCVNESINEVVETVTNSDIKENQSTIVVISSDVMGNGDDVLGKTLLKGYIYAMTQLDTAPDYILLYNGGVRLSIIGADTLQDLLFLEENGTKIASCGACLDYYEVTDKLAVGEITNMYAIADLLSKASRIIKP